MYSDLESLISYFLQILHHSLLCILFVALFCQELEDIVAEVETEDSRAEVLPHFVVELDLLFI